MCAVKNRNTNITNQRDPLLMCETHQAHRIASKTLCRDGFFILPEFLYCRCKINRSRITRTQNHSMCASARRSPKIQFIQKHNDSNDERPPVLLGHSRNDEGRPRDGLR